MKSNAFEYARPLPLIVYTEQIPMNHPPVLWHVNVAREVIWPAVVSVPSKEQKLLSSSQLQNGINEQNAEPPKPEKPKWEEEQYPDIGKSILPFKHFKLILSHRHPIKSSSISVNTTSSQINSVLQNRTPYIPNNASFLPNSPSA